MRLFCKLKSLRYVSKAKLSLIALGITAIVVVLALALNMLAITIPEAKDTAGYSRGISAEKIKGKSLEDSRSPQGFKLIAENDSAVLFFNDTNARISVLHKSSEKYWHSNPLDSDSDTLATGANRGKLESQIAIDYYDANGKSGTFNSFEDCIEQETLEFEFIENGIRVLYIMGDQKITRQMLPAVVEKKRFEDKVLRNLDEDQQEEILSFYELTSVEESSKNNAKKYQELYTSINTGEQYYFLDLYTADYKYDDVYALLFDAAGYTLADVEQDNEAVGYNIEVESFRQITVPVEYTISGGDLLVNIPAADITCPEGLYLTKISLLPFFGATTITDNGYMLVPDGSGALINYNNGRTASTGYVLPVYGTEPALDQQQARFLEPSANIPVFGLVNENTSATLGIIESGEAHASIVAQISGVDTMYNQLYPTFEILPKDIMEVHSNATQIVTNVYQEQPYDGYITVRYKFTDETQADYSALATVYRDYLIENGILENKATNRKLVVSLTGKVEVEDSFFGIPYSAEKTLTSFGGAAKIVDELKQSGVDNIAVGFNSWFGGGTRHDAVNGRLKIASGLGGKKALSALNDALGDGNLSLGADLIKTYHGFPQFNSFSYAARRITNNIKRVDLYNPATYMPDEKISPYYLLSPKYFESVLDDFNNSVSNLGVSSLWLGDGGNLLSSDFKVGSTIDREASKYYITSALEKVSDKADITFENPNLYALKYCDTAVGVPTTSSGSNLIDRDVPFIQIVLSGTVNYTGDAINRNGDTVYNLLKAVETGSDLYYEWIYVDNTVVGGYKGTQAKSLYSMYYGNWIDGAAEFYCRMKTELSAISGKSITAHRRVDTEVYVTYYGDIAVAVNYGDTTATVDGVEVEAKNFKVLGGNS